MQQIEHSITINRPRDEVYDGWRDLDNWPRLFDRVQAVEYVSAGRSRWTIAGPGGRAVHWDAEIVDDRPGARLAWRSLEGADVPNEGRLEFQDAPGDRGTEVRAFVAYDSPGDGLGALIAKMLGDDPKALLREAMRRFKQVAETGEVLLSDGRREGAGEGSEQPAQPAGGMR